MSKVKDIGVMEVVNIFDKCLEEDYRSIVERGGIDYEENERIANELLNVYDRLDRDTRKLLDYVTVLITHILMDAYGKGKVHPADLEFLIAHYCVMVSYRVLQKFGVV